MTTGKSAEKSSRRYVGLIGMWVILAVNTFLMGLLVWCVLLIGFGCYHLAHPGMDLSQQLQTIAKPNREFLQNSRWLKNAGDQILASQTVTLLHKKLQEATHGLPEMPRLIQSYWHRLKQAIVPLIYGVTGIVGTRILEFLLAMPLFFLCLSLGFIDGLVQRDIRKFQGARESTLLFHALKRNSAFWFYAPLFIYLALPLPIAPQWFLIPMAIILSVFMQWSTKSFKKYI